MTDPANTAPTFTTDHMAALTDDALQALAAAGHTPTSHLWRVEVPHRDDLRSAYRSDEMGNPHRVTAKTLAVLVDRGLVRAGEFSPANTIPGHEYGRRPYVITDAGRAALARVFTVTIEVSDDGQIWQAVDPAETIGDAFTADPQQVARDTEANQTYIDTEDGGAGLWRIRVWRGADADTCTEPDADYYPPAGEPEAAETLELVTDTSDIEYDDPENFPDGYTVGYVVPAGTALGATGLGDYYTMRQLADDTIHIPVADADASWERGLRERIADIGDWAIAGPVAADGTIVRVEVRKGGE